MDINVNINGTITLTADKPLLAALSGAKVQQELIPLPQTVAEQAARAQVVPTPAPMAVPTPAYAAPTQQYLPAPENPTPAPRPAAPVVPVAAASTAQTSPSVATSAPPAAPVTTFTAPTAMPVNPAPVAPVAVAPAFAMEDLARAASQLMDAGKQQDLLGLLAQFGVQALTQLPTERYGEFATALRQMGAKL